MGRMKRVTATAGGSVVHVETPLGIVNITAGLTDSEGRRVDSISISPDNGKVLSGFHNTRIVEPLSSETKAECQAVLDEQARPERGIDLSPLGDARDSLMAELDQEDALRYSCNAGCGATVEMAAQQCSACRALDEEQAKHTTKVLETSDVRRALDEIQRLMYGDESDPDRVEQFEWDSDLGPKIEAILFERGLRKGKPREG